MTPPVSPLDDDELAGLAEVACELGRDLGAVPQVRRIGWDAGAAGTLSALKWGEDTPELVLLHGGGQNAHTWDLLLSLLGRPAIAFDLPGHGHSTWRADRDYNPWTNADTLAPAIAALAPAARAMVGMSLGGATVIRLAAERPDLVRRAVIVDVTPQVNDPARRLTREQKGAVALVGGQPSFASFDEMADAAVALSPRRLPAAVRRGVRHNARQDADGRWVWRYDLFGPPGSRPVADFTRLWADVERMTMPTLLVVGGASHHVTREDVAQMSAALPGLRVETVADAGHAVQSDQPHALAALIEDFVFAN